MLADHLRRRGRRDACFQVGGVALLALALAIGVGGLNQDPMLAWIVVSYHALTSPLGYGTALATLTEITPPSLRSRVAAIYGWASA
jgi:hypothetical protein